MVRASPEALGTNRIQAVLIKAVQFTASLAWLSPGVNHGHAACDINAEQHEGHVEVEDHGHGNLSLEAERTDVQRKKAAECQRKGGKKCKAYPFLLLKHRSSKRRKGTLCKGIPKGKV